MTTREYLDEQLVAQETATNRRALTELRDAWKRSGVRLSESAALQMCVRTALPRLEAASPQQLEEWVVEYKVLPGASRNEPLDQQVIAQETGANRGRLYAVRRTYDHAVTPPRKGNASLGEASVVRLCIALALPDLLQRAQEA